MAHRTGDVCRAATLARGRTSVGRPFRRGVGSRRRARHRDGDPARIAFSPRSATPVRTITVRKGRTVAQATPTGDRAAINSRLIRTQDQLHIYTGRLFSAPARAPPLSAWQPLDVNQDAVQRRTANLVPGSEPACPESSHATALRVNRSPDKLAPPRLPSPQALCPVIGDRWPCQRGLTPTPLWVNRSRNVRPPPRPQSTRRSSPECHAADRLAPSIATDTAPPMISRRTRTRPFPSRRCRTPRLCAKGPATTLTD